MTIMPIPSHGIPLAAQLMRVGVLLCMSEPTLFLFSDWYGVSCLAGEH